MFSTVKGLRQDMNSSLFYAITSIDLINVFIASSTLGHGAISVVRSCLSFLSTAVGIIRWGFSQSCQHPCNVGKHHL